MKPHPTAAVDLFGAYHAPAQGSVLAETWEYPPFSVLNARDGWWQARKRQWLALGIESELGRGGQTPVPVAAPCNSPAASANVTVPHD